MPDKPDRLWILMRHDPSGHNLEYLYSYAKVVGSLLDEHSSGGVDIVEIFADVDADLNYCASYQLGRLQSGLEARSPLIFPDYQLAEREANAVIRLLTRNTRNKEKEDA